MDAFSIIITEDKSTLGMEPCTDKLKSNGHRLHTKRIAFLIKLAAINGVAVSIDDLTSIIPESQKPVSVGLKSMLEEQPSKYVMRSGYVLPSKDSMMLQETLKRKEHSKRSVRLAAQLVKSHPTLYSDAVVVAVAGSTSYSAARPEHDTDLLLVTRDGKLWITLLKLLLFTRALRLTSRYTKQMSDYCYSIAFTESEMHSFLKSHADPLLGRELLKLVPVKGSEELQRIVARQEWITRFYPGARISATEDNGKRPDRPSHSSFEPLVYLVVAKYLSLSAVVRNRLFRLRGLLDDVFTFKHSPGFMTYESRRYQFLRNLYLDAFSEGDSCLE